MSNAILLVFAAVGAVAAAAGAGTLLARCFRAPRADLIAWSVALLGLLVSLGAQLLGYLAGYDAAIFRAMAIGGLVIAPLAVILGLTEVASKGLAARFCARVYIAALAIVALVILVLDQLGSATFTKSWPNPHAYYQSPPNYMLYAVSVVTVIIAAIAVGIVMARSGDRDWSRASTPHVAAGVAALLLAYPGLALLARYEAKQSLPLGTVFTPLLAIAAGLLFWSGLKLSGQDVSALHARGGSARGGSARGGSARGGSDRGDAGSRWRADDDGRYAADETSDFGRYDDRDDYGDRYRPEPVPERPRQGQPHPDDDAYEYGWDDRGQQRDGWADDGPAAGDRDGRYAGDYADDGYGRDEFEADDYHTGDFQTGDFQTGDFGTGDFAASDYPAASAGPALAAPADEGDQSRKDLFGQIAIYTLLEDRVHEFDQLTERVVEEVRGREPDTLVFIVHAVPSAPMQRILYEVYRDRTAYEWHRQQPYVTQFESDRRPYVLATNVIELGLQQAKVSPFPSVAELFGEPGYDTSGFERPDYLRDYGRPSASHGDARGSGRW
jgi:quinol monooxygenase YgiN